MKYDLYIRFLLCTLVLLALPSPLSMQQTSVHTVQCSETLSGTAWNYGMTAQAIMDANNLTYNTIYAGQQSVIPTERGTPVIIQY